jgi:hypothetical protein
MKKILNYFLYITKNLDAVAFEKECLLKVLEYLKSFKFKNPINFLKVTLLFI